MSRAKPCPPAPHVFVSRSIAPVKKDSAPPKPRAWLFCTVLAALALGLYAPSVRHHYITCDDNEYVYENPRVSSGLTPGNVAWAFTSRYWACNWHPITWLSHMLDCQLFGANPGPQHAVNALFHSANVALLFLALLRMTTLPWRSACVAALFAVHPVHVESVAWIAERKDVLSTFFGLLTILVYQRYAQQQSRTRYAAVALVFSLGLMSKPMLVTLPFVLLLLDYWPLERLRTRAQFWPLFLEKTPLLVLSAGACIMTVLAQRAGAIVSLEALSVYRRIGHAVLGYGRYAGKLLWPNDLIFPYPFEPSANLAAILLSAIVLVFAIVAAFEFGARRRYFPVGLFWYLGTFVPVIGLVQVGGVLIALRYLYLPSIGLYIAVVWACADFLPRKLCAAMAVVAIAVFSVLALRQLGHWKNSETLYKHTLSVTPNNLDAINGLSWTYSTSPDLKLRNGAEAVRWASVAVEATNRTRANYLDTLAAAYAAAGDLDHAIATAREALQKVDTGRQPLMADLLTARLQRYETEKAEREK